MPPKKGQRIFGEVSETVPELCCGKKPKVTKIHKGSLIVNIVYCPECYKTSRLSSGESAPEAIKAWNSRRYHTLEFK